MVNCFLIKYVIISLFYFMKVSFLNVVLYFTLTVKVNSVYSETPIRFI